MTQPTLFIVDDDVGFVHAAADIARQRGFDISVAGSVEQATARLRRTTFDIALVDLSLPDGSGLELLDHMELGERTQVVIITGHPTVESTLKAMRLPIVDYVLKPLEAMQFSELLDKANRRRRTTSDPGQMWHGLAGRSAAMAALQEQVRRVAGTEASVFIEGESGVGKELVASAIHAESGRSGPFVALNCGACPSELLSSQLFGHERGSFTGANARHAGLFEQAEGGSLFLDEITEMPLQLQVHLLRALETRRIRRVGGTEDLEVNVRIVSATNRSPREAIETAHLREDLYYRLAEFPMAVPPLREHPEDIQLIADLVLARLNERYKTRHAFTQEGRQRMQRYNWPGNVRELKNLVQRAYILAEGDLVTPVPPEHFDRPVSETESTITFAIGTPIHEMERRMLFKTLAFFDNNKVRAAQALGVTTKTIYNRLSAYQGESPRKERRHADFGETESGSTG